MGKRRGTTTCVQEEDRREGQNAIDEQKITDIADGNYCVQMLLNSYGKILPQMFAEGFFSKFKKKYFMKTASGLERTKI